MMRRWMMALCAAGALTGCQIEDLSDPSTSEASQAASGDICSCQMPQVGYWNGSQPPLPGEGQMYIIFTPENNYSLAALVDHKNAKVPYATKVHSGKRNSFIAMTQGQYGRIITGGNPPPPPDITGEILGAYLVAQARRIDAARLEAVTDAQTCSAQ